MKPKAKPKSKPKTSRQKPIDTLLVSDVHLGSEVSRASALLELLKKSKFKRLVLLGDIFDDLNFNRLKHDHWDLVSYFRHLTNQKRDVEVIWVFGNHDELLVRVMQAFLGLKVREHYTWEIAGKKFFAIHGHQFDYFLIHNRFMSDVATWIYRIIQKFDTAGHAISRYLKRTSKGWLRVSKDVALGGMKLGQKKGADYVFCGHTHKAMKLSIDGLKYFNTGCWTDLPSTYVTIDTDAHVESHDEN